MADILKGPAQDIAVLDDVYDSICEYEWLYQSHLEARKGKRYRNDVLVFTDNLEENLIQIQNELLWETYSVGKYRSFYVREPKLRLVMALQYRTGLCSGRYTKSYIHSMTRPLSRTATLAGETREHIRQPTSCNTGSGRSTGSRDNGIT